MPGGYHNINLINYKQNEYRRKRRRTAVKTKKGDTKVSIEKVLVKMGIEELMVMPAIIVPKGIISNVDNTIANRKMTEVVTTIVRMTVLLIMIMVITAKTISLVMTIAIVTVLTATIARTIIATMAMDSIKADMGIVSMEIVNHLTMINVLIIALISTTITNLRLQMR